MARSNRDKTDGGIDIEPYSLTGANFQMAFYSLQDRYKFARFVYECLFASSQDGQTCFDPLLYHYPQVPHSYSDIEHTFLINDAIKVSPVLQSLANETDKNFYVFFPYGRWVDMDNYTVVNVENVNGTFVDLEAQTTVKKHLRPGYIVPVQYNITDTSEQYAMNMEQLLFTQTHLMINRDESGFAKGKVFFDQGASISEITYK